MNTYQQLIGNYCHHTISPRLVEGWMRLEFGTLDHLSTRQFIDAVIAAEREIVADPKLSEKLAQSYGL